VNITNAQSVFTVIMFVLFVGIIAWAWSGARKSAFTAAAQLPFIEDGSANETETQQ
jgi:cytochrome c oxidase cbb3-type subunit IV